MLVPSAFTAATGRDHWEVLLRARGIENGCFVVAAGQWGVHGADRHCYGHSMVVDPWGTVLAVARDGVGLCTAELDLGAVDRVAGAAPRARASARRAVPRLGLSGQTGGAARPPASRAARTGQAAAPSRRRHSSTAAATSPTTTPTSRPTAASSLSELGWGLAGGAA